jgi:hypothetical protein
MTEQEHCPLGLRRRQECEAKGHHKALELWDQPYTAKEIISGGYRYSLRCCTVCYAAYWDVEEITFAE